MALRRATYGLLLMWGEIAGWLAVTAGLVAGATLVRLDQNRKAARDRPTQTVRKCMDRAPLEKGHEWARVADPAMRGLARGAELPGLHLQAMHQIDAAEHAFNKLVAACALVGCRIALPTIEPVRQLVHKPVPDPVQQSLAA